MKMMKWLLGSLVVFTVMQANADTFQWANDACVKYDDQNEYVGVVEAQNCERSQGVIYVWDTGGGCAKYTSGHSYIAGVDPQFCRASSGSFFHRTDEYCGEFTLKGDLIRVVDDNKCN